MESICKRKGGNTQEEVRKGEKIRADKKRKWDEIREVKFVKEVEKGIIKRIEHYEMWYNIWERKIQNLVRVVG